MLTERESEKWIGPNNCRQCTPLLRPDSTVGDCRIVTNHVVSAKQYSGLPVQYK